MFLNQNNKDLQYSQKIKIKLTIKKIKTKNQPLFLMISLTPLITAAMNPRPNKIQKYTMIR